LIVHLQLIDCGFDGWLLLPQVCLNKLLLTDVVI
jgi:predicted aspartyl protease